MPSFPRVNRTPRTTPRTAGRRALLPIAVLLVSGLAAAVAILLPAEHASSASSPTDAVKPAAGAPVLTPAAAATTAPTPTAPALAVPMPARAPAPAPTPAANPATTPPVAAVATPAPAASAAPTTAAAQVCMVLTGSRASELESCGCHAKQTGGIDREAFIYQNLRRAFSGFIGLDAGGWTDPMQSANERLKTDYLVKAMRALDFAVFNVTPLDIAFGTTYPLQLTEGTKSHLVAANLLTPATRDDGTTEMRHPYAPYAIVDVPTSGHTIRVGVIGISDPAALDPAMLQHLKAIRTLPRYELTDPEEALATHVPTVRAQADVVVVLAMMDRRRAPMVAGRYEGIDVFVTALGVQALRQENRVPGKVLVNSGYHGRFFTKALASFNAERRLVDFKSSLEDIPTDGPPLADVTKFLDQYREATKELARRIAVAQEKSRFVGRVRCLSCHRAEYMQWVQTPHNRAFATLVEKRQHFNPDCLKCHVTGYNEADGFVDTMQTGHLVSVQCEVCHGPAREHTTALSLLVKPTPQGRVEGFDPKTNYPRLPSKTPEEVCRKCHVPDHDPNFVYERDLKYISHELPQGPFVRPKEFDTMPAPAMEAMGN